MSSLLRRAKSFIVRKDQQSGPESPTRKQQKSTTLKRKNSRTLQKQKSMSLESVPITLQLEQSELFRRQRRKIKEDVESSSSSLSSSLSLVETVENDNNNRAPTSERGLKTSDRCLATSPTSSLTTSDARYLATNDQRCLATSDRCLATTSEETTDEQPTAINRTRSNKSNNNDIRMRLERRTSRSLDEIRLNVHDESILRSLRNQRKRNNRDGGRCNTYDVCKDLIDNFKECDEDETSESAATANSASIRAGLGHFPTVTDDDQEDRDENGAAVELRARPNNDGVEVRRRYPVDTRPKTYNPTTTTVTRGRDEPPFQVRGPVRIELGTHQCIKLFDKETLQAANGLLKLLPKGQVLRDNVQFRPGTTLVSKRDVEMTLTDTTPVLFHFETSKDARHFVEAEKHRTADAIEKISIKRRLLKLLGKRSSREILESKGIIKNEPIFGNTLTSLYEINGHRIPEFVSRIVELIERPQNVSSLGLYRTSPNLATVQKIRCEVDCGHLEILEQFARDPDVLTGALKLFFRELREPLIPYETYLTLQQLVDNSQQQHQNQNIGDQVIKTIDQTMPTSHKQTLYHLLKHMIRVCQFKDENKMDFHNMAVSWGPSLIAIPDNQCSDLVIQTTQFYKITTLLLETYSDQFQDELTTKSPALAQTTTTTVQNVAKPQDFIYGVVAQITAIVDAHVTLEGIYRRSGSNAKIDNILRRLKNQNEFAFDANKTKKQDVFDLCGALKQFLAGLDQPLVPKEMFDHYCMDCDNNLDDNTIRNNVRSRIRTAPRWPALRLLLRHLRNVLAHHKQNRINLDTVTHIFVATLMGAEGNNRTAKTRYFKMLIDMADQDDSDDSYCQLPDLLPPVAVKCHRDSRYDNQDEDEDSESKDRDRSATRL